MQLRDSYLKGIMREKAQTAQNALFDMKTMLSEAPENMVYHEEIDLALNEVANLIVRLK